MAPAFPCHDQTPLGAGFHLLRGEPRLSQSRQEAQMGTPRGGSTSEGGGHASAALRHFPCCPPPLTPAQLRQPLHLSQPPPPPSRCLRPSAQHLSLDLLFCPLPILPTIQADSGCLWVGNVCPWGPSPQPQFLSSCLHIYVSLTSLSFHASLPCLFLFSVSLSFSFRASLSLPISVFPCLCRPC